MLLKATIPSQQRCRGRMDEPHPTRRNAGHCGASLRELRLGFLEHTLPCVGGKAVATVGHKNAKVTRLLRAIEGAV